MAHRRAKLTPFGRLLIVQRVHELGWTVAEATKAAGNHPAWHRELVKRKWTYRQRVGRVGPSIDPREYTVGDNDGG